MVKKAQAGILILLIGFVLLISFSMIPPYWSDAAKLIYVGMCVLVMFLGAAKG